MVINSKKLYQYLIDWVKNLVKTQKISGFISPSRFDLVSILTILIINDSKSVIEIKSDDLKIIELCKILNIKVLSLYNIEDKNDLLIVGNKTRNDCKLIRNYQKYGDGLFDVNLFQDIFDSELYELINYRKIVAEEQEKKLFSYLNNINFEERRIKNILANDIQWADILDMRTNLITSPKDPSKSTVWYRLSLKQRKVAAKIHQIEKLTRHKEFTHIHYPRLRDMQSLVLNN